MSRLLSRLSGVLRGCRSTTATAVWLERGLHEPFPLRIGDFKFTNQTKLCSVNQIVNEKWLGIGIVVNGISLIWSGLVSVIIIYAAENAVDIILNALALFFIQQIDNEIMSPRETDALKAYYLLYAARYSQGMVSVFIEHKRKDFWEMLVHHFVTVSLIGISYVYGWNRVGAVVMILLDPADVPLHIAKQFKYVGDARGGSTQKIMQSGADLFFVIFMLLFAVMRLGIYPYVVWSAHVEGREYFSYGLGAWTCIALLYILLLLQIYWFVLILKVAIKVITSGAAEEVRSDEDDEDSGSTLKKNK